MDYRKLLAQSQDLPPKLRPVELESGPQLLADVRRESQYFKQQILPELGLSELTAGEVERK